MQDMSEFYKTNPGDTTTGDDGCRKAPIQYREDVTAALINAGIHWEHAEVIVIDNRVFLLEAKRKRLTAQQAADDILDKIGDFYRGKGQV